MIGINICLSGLFVLLFNISILHQVKSKSSLRLKAAILFAVFAMNTMRSVACTLDVDRIVHRVLNMVHEHDEETENATKPLIHFHANGKKHEHDNKKRTSSEDDCCNKTVVSFDQIDKTPGQHIRVNLVLPVCELPLFFILGSTISSRTISKVPNFPFRELHLPSEDIRVSIRSFQI